MIDEILNIFEGIIFISYLVDMLFLWVLIVANVILNHSIFGFKNIKIYILNISTILLYVLQFIYLEYLIKKRIFIIVFLIFLLYIIYIINSIFLSKKTRISCYIMWIFLVLCILYVIIYFTANLEIEYIFLSYLSILKLVLLFYNICMSNNYLNNQFLKYTIIFINMIYVVISIYQGIIFSLNPDL